jgi:hypothetical protein
VQESFIEFRLIDKFFAVGKGNYGSLRLLSQDGIDSQGEEE